MERKWEGGARDAENAAQETLMNMACSSEFSKGCIAPGDEEHATVKDETPQAAVGLADVLYPPMS